MSTSTPPNGEADTFITMEVGDVEAIGAHCEVCRDKDLLPNKCMSCHMILCSKHASESAHNCPKAGEWARQRRLKELGEFRGTTTPKPNHSNSEQCSEPHCKTFIDTPQNPAVRCDGCNHQYCLKHRMREDHDCKNVIPLGARIGANGQVQQSNKEKLRLGFGRLKTWGKSQQTEVEKRMESFKPKPKPTSAAARLAALNQLKKDAKGDDKIPAEKRIYLHVEAEKESTRAKMPQAKLWFNQEWAVGRVLDEATKRLQVPNENNTKDNEADRLRIFHIEGGRVLEYKEKLGQAVQNGNTIVVLKGIGPSAPSVRT
jgi:AN1-type zinc finger protein 1